MRILPRKTVNIKFSTLSTALRYLLKRNFGVGAEVNKFEKAFASYIDAECAIAVSSARVGLRYVFEAFGFKPGEKVILCAYNFHIIPALLKSMGLLPVFVDIDPETCNINVDKIEEKIDSDVKFLVATHMFGQPCDMLTITKLANKHNLKVIEDCAHAIGAEYNGRKVGTFGDAACFSFGIGKGLVAFGGGIITTNNCGLYEKIKKRVNHLRPPSSFAVIRKALSGLAATVMTRRVPYSLFIYPLDLLLSFFNIDLEEVCDCFEHSKPFSKPDKAKQVIFTRFQAAVGLEQLKNIEYFNSRRQANSNQLRNGLEGVIFIRKYKLIPEANSMYLYYPAILNMQILWKLKKYLIKKGIDTKISMQRDCSGGICLNSAKINNNVLELPNSYALNSKDMKYIIRIINKYVCT